MNKYFQSFTIVLVVLLFSISCRKEKKWEPFADGKIKYVSVLVNDSANFVLKYNVNVKLLVYSPNLYRNEFNFSCPVANGNLELQLYNGSYQSGAEERVILPQVYDVKKNGANSRCSLTLCDLASASFKINGEEYKTNDTDNGYIKITSFTSFEDYTSEISGIFDVTVYNQTKTDSFHITGDFDKLKYPTS